MPQTVPPPTAQEVAAFAQQVTTLQRPLFVYLTSLIGQTADVEDLLQEVNRVMWEKYAEFTPGSSLAAWAYRIAYFEVLRFRKTRVRDRLLFDEDTMVRLADEAGSVAEQDSGRRSALLSCLDNLASEDREIVTRRYLTGIDVRDLAVQVGRSEKAVYRTLARIRSLLLDCVQRKLAAEARR